MKDYKVILFDLDGTLTNPERGLIASFSYGLQKMNIDYGDKMALKRFIGPPLYETWKNEYSLSTEEATRALNLFREYYAIYGWWDNEVYPGVSEMLARLKNSGKRLMLATSKPEVFAKKVLRLFNLDQYFEFVGAASTDKTRDKKWEVIEYIFSTVGLTDKSSVLMVGDRFFDADGAQRCGIDSLGVLYGHGSFEELSKSGFNYIVENVSDIADLILDV